MDLLDDIGDKLIADGLVDGVSGWKLFKSYMPESSENQQVVSIYELPGVEPDQTHGIAYEYPAFQIFVRGNPFEYDVARTKIKEIYNSLNNASIAGYTYIYASDSGPLLEGYDKENRPVLFWSFRTMKAPNTMVIMESGGMVAGAEEPSVGSPDDSFNITVPSASMGATGN